MPQVPGSIRGHLDQAARAAQIATDLTRQMLAYTGKGRFVVKRIDLDKVVRENLQLLRASIAKSIVFDVQLSEGLPLIEADAGQVQQVTMNLITNAADAIGDRVGRITAVTGVQTCDAATLRRSRVEVAPAAGDFVFLEVRDDGCGMEGETLERLFEPFFTTRATGRGLGMSAILGIVRSHHGAIFVDSAPGVGTSFRVLFPVCGPALERDPENEAPTLGASTTQPRGLNGTVLIVDDEELMRQLGQHMLQRLGLDAIVVADGVEAVKLFKARSSDIDCVIVDLTMPIMDGLAVLTELQRIRPNIPVVLSSGYDEQESKRRLPEGGTVAFLQKPYTLNQLRAVLAEALSRPAN
jgi:CheY-like chemotaxis protein